MGSLLSISGTLLDFKKIPCKHTMIYHTTTTPMIHYSQCSKICKQSAIWRSRSVYFKQAITHLLPILSNNFSIFRALCDLLILSIILTVFVFFTSFLTKPNPQKFCTQNFLNIRDLLDSLHPSPTMVKRQYEISAPFTTYTHFYVIFYNTYIVRFEKKQAHVSIVLYYCFLLA